MEISHQVLFGSTSAVGECKGPWDALTQSSLSGNVLQHFNIYRSNLIHFNSESQSAHDKTLTVGGILIPEAEMGSKGSLWIQSHAS